MKRVQKGICMEVNDGRSVFMLGNGQFVHGQPVGTAGLGEESLFYPLETKSKFKITSLIAPALTAVAVMMLLLTTILPQGEAYAYVQVQVNPGVEIGMDEDKQVVSIRELNEDGQKLIEELGEWENLSLEDVLSRILLLAPMEAGDELTITTVLENSDPTIGKVIEKAVLASTSASLNGERSVLLKTASQEQRQQAVKENIPVGQLVKESKKLTNHAKPEKETEVKEPPGLNKINEAPPLSSTPPAKTKQEKQEKIPPGQEKKNDAPGQIRKQENPPAGQEKKKENSNPPADKKAPVQKEKKDHAPGQERKDPPAQQKKKDEAEKQQPNASKNVEKGNNGNKENKGDKGDQGDKGNKGNGNQND